MRKFWLGIVMVLVVALPGIATAGVEGFARISLVQGEVQVRDEESNEWLPAGVNTPLEEGDSIWSPAGSRVEIQFRNGTYLRLEGRTIVDLVDIEQDQQRVHVASGRLYVKTGSRADDLQVDWGDASVLVERKTRLKVDLLANGDEEVAIIKGAASVESAGERTRVRAGEIITLHDYRGSDIAPLRPVDEWERWNAKRDKQLAARKRGDSYLPDELSIYEDELAGNGDWIVVEEYGYVWRPRMSVTVDWAPYRHGRWVWRGSDYVWITSEPWGWAPYHYGRWAMVPGRGWCWVPPTRGDVYWGPGYVAWVSTGSQVGWVPLAPRETYYGRGHYGRYSMDIGRNDHRPVNVTYRNVTINNAITVVNREGFARGTGRHEIARENIFRQQHVVPRPDVRPLTRDARMPTIKPVTVTQPPPSSVRRPPVRELRERYPLLREEKRGERRSDVPAASGRERRPEPRSNVTTAPAVTTLPSAVPPRREVVVPPRERQPETRPDKVVPPPAAPPRPENAPPRSQKLPEQKTSETRVVPQVPVPGPEKGKEGAVRSESPRGDVKQRGPRRAWRIETREQSQQQQVRDTAPKVQVQKPQARPETPKEQQQEQKQEQRQEQRQERRRRGD